MIPVDAEGRVARLIMHCMACILSVCVLTLLCVFMPPSSVRRAGLVVVRWRPAWPDVYFASVKVTVSCSMTCSSQLPDTVWVKAGRICRCIYTSFLQLGLLWALVFLVALPLPVTIQQYSFVALFWCVCACVVIGQETIFILTGTLPSY